MVCSRLCLSLSQKVLLVPWYFSTMARMILVPTPCSAPSVFQVDKLKTSLLASAFLNFTVQESESSSIQKESSFLSFSGILPFASIALSNKLCKKPIRSTGIIHSMQVFDTWI